MSHRFSEQLKNVLQRIVPCAVIGREKGGVGVEKHLNWKSNSSYLLGMLWEQPNGFLWNLLQMIALVMDSFTDTDIFTDLLEACSQRQVKAYILLDQSSFSHFLKMCKDLGVDLEQEKVSLVIFLGTEIQLKKMKGECPVCKRLCGTTQACWDCKGWWKARSQGSLEFKSLWG